MARASVRYRHTTSNLRGLRRHGQGWQASVFVTGLPRSYRTFPVDTAIEEIQAWRVIERHRLQLQRGEDVIVGRLPAGTFAADAERYLKSVRALRDFRGREYDIARWVDVFGPRRTLTIRPHEIRAQRDIWLTTGPKRVYNKQAKAWQEVDEPLAASTVNHRLRALENLFTVLFPQGYNPVRDVPEAEEPKPEDRSQPYSLLVTILAHMPDRGAPERDKKRPTISKSKARLTLMAYTGLTHSQVMQLTPSDLDLTLPAIRVRARHKGKGAAGGWKPLPVDAKAALEGFIAADAFGRFSRHSLRKSWLRACEKADRIGIRPYDLRHSFATRILDVTRDIRATQMLLNHANPKTTERYAKRAIPSWLAASVEQVTLGPLAQSAGTIANGTPRKTQENSGKKRSTT